jgi:hypothetical protein
MNDEKQTLSNGANWQDREDADLVRQVADMAAASTDGYRVPSTVAELLDKLTAEGWAELDTLAGVPEGAAEPTVMEWCGLALADFPMTDQGRARGAEFEKALARIAAPGLLTRSALARMKEAAKAWRRSIVATAADDTQLEFENVVPAPKPEALEEIAHLIATAFDEWIDAPVEYVDIMVIWAIGTWGLLPGCPPRQAGIDGGPMFYPYLWITSVDPNSGKSTALRSLAAAVRRAMSVQRITPSAMFRTLAALQPTPLIDEVGRFVTGNKDLEGLLDAACYRDGVVRLVEKVGTAGGGETFATRKFFCFAPMAMGGLGAVAPTILSRSIRLRMTPAGPSRKPVRLADHMRAVSTLAEKVGPHLAAHADAIRARLERGPSVALPPDLINRDADVWEPMFAVAELIGGEWPERCVAANRLLGRPRQATADTLLRALLDALQAFQRARAFNYASVGEVRSPMSPFGALGPSQAPTAYDPHVPLHKVPTNNFHRWLSFQEAAEFAVSTAGFGEKPLSLTKIGLMLAEVDVFSHPFEFKRDGHRQQIRIYDLEDLERVWGERRSSS